MVWEQIFAPAGIRREEIPFKITCILHVPPEVKDKVWKDVRDLTQRNRLGCRSAISPGTFTSRKGTFYSLVLDSPARKKADVDRKLVDYKLNQYSQGWRNYNNAFGH